MIPGRNGAVGSASPRAALDYLRRATAFLATRGADTPRLDAEVLLAAALATDRVGVYLRFDQPLGASEVERYRALIRRRAAGEPVAYVTGRREFWSCDLMVTPDVLIPRPETEVLVERALDLVGDRRRPIRVLDLGTGSGAIAIALAAELPASRVLALDVSAPAAAVARANVAATGLGARVDVAVGDWTAPLRCETRFDLIVSNPPYVETGALAGLSRAIGHEPRVALDGGADGLVAYRRLVPSAVPLLAAGGALLVEVGLGQATAVAALFAASGLGEVVSHADLAAVARVVMGTSPGEPS